MLTGKGENAAPDNISDKLWSEVTRTKDEAWIKRFTNFANEIQTPEGFNDPDLWSKIGNDDKKDFLLAENKLRNEEKEFKLTGKGETAAPDNISDELWSEVLKIKTERKDQAWIKRFTNFANKIQRPQGFNDPDLWSSMCKDDKNLFLEAEHQIRYVNERCIQGFPGLADSHVGRFFLDFDADDFNFDSGVSAFALLNALVLTIPYGVIMNLNGEFYDKLYASWLTCEVDKPNMAKQSGGEGTFHDYLISNLSVANYGSISGLIMATLYYVFKPTDSTALSRWSKKKIRILVMAIFISTVAAIFGIMLAWAALITVFSRRTDEYCELNPSGESVWKSGTVSIVMSLLLGFVLMW